VFPENQWLLAQGLFRTIESFIIKDLIRGVAKGYIQEKGLQGNYPNQRLFINNLI
jgi:hypothetical protein